MNDAEMQALLSAYAAGTLSNEQRDRLFEKALNNQALFDALADEEAMKAALANPQVKQQLLQQLRGFGQQRPTTPAPNRWLWVGLAGALVVGVLSVAFWPKPKEVPQIVAMAKPESPQSPRVKLEEPPPAAKPLAKAAERAATNSAIPAIAESRSMSDRKQIEEKLASNETPPPPAVKREETVPAAKAVEKVAEVVVADSAVPTSANSSPVASFVPAAATPTNRVRLEAKTAGNRVEVFNGSLVVGANAKGYLYAFVVDANQTRPVRLTNPVRAGTIPIGEHSNPAEVWFVLTKEEDDVLQRATTGVLPLPSRNWKKVKLN
ncbi:MAG: hypothetical protein FJW36_11805 [Acidobacteria bacterium]|nr:hypothetical protein [Acidobacteriota bacterium]